ncbi:MAG: DUF1015 domain-containing protein [Eubacteriales bacterium]
MTIEQKLGIKVPEVLLPDNKVNMRKWAVIACDQYTSNLEYWREVSHIVGSAPSVLHMILPEAYLDASDRDDRIAHAKTVMKQYIEDEVLVQLPRGIILVERQTSVGKRKGLMFCVDLEEYDFKPKNKSLIRATENTVIERIPPRMDLRRSAVLESSHIILLMNDEEDSVIGPVYRKKESLYSLYKFELMQTGGQVSGWFIDNEEEINEILESILNLKKNDKMLFAVGDGNHSLATAKAIWDEAKEDLSEEEKKDHPLRYALVEIVNLYDPGISFEPIHRVVFNVEPSRLIVDLMEILKSKGYNTKVIYSRMKGESTDKMQVINFVTKESTGRIEILNPKFENEIETLQDILDDYMAKNDKVKLDYIHGEEAFDSLSRQYDCIGFIMPALNKDKLFDIVEKNGLLPQKSFSLGEPNEKRYYIECRLIVPATQKQTEEVAVEEKAIKENIKLEEKEAMAFEETAEIEAPKGEKAKAKKKKAKVQEAKVEEIQEEAIAEENKTDNEVKPIIEEIEIEEVLLKGRKEKTKKAAAKKPKKEKNIEIEFISE